MKIEHIALYVRDLENARDFFEKYMGGHSNGGYHNKKTDFRSYFITFDDGARLEDYDTAGGLWSFVKKERINISLGMCIWL